MNVNISTVAGSSGRLCVFIEVTAKTITDGVNSVTIEQYFSVLEGECLLEYTGDWSLDNGTFTIRKDTEVLVQFKKEEYKGGYPDDKSVYLDARKDLYES